MARFTTRFISFAMQSPVFLPLIAASLLFASGNVAFAEGAPSRETRPEALVGVSVTELARREVWQGGRRLSLVRIRSPVFPPRAAEAVAPAPVPTAEELAREAELAAKDQHGLTFFGGVFPGDATTPRLTKVRLERREADTARVAHVWLPLDLRMVDGVGVLETADAVFHFTIFLAAGVFDTPPEPEHAPLLALWAEEAATAPDAGAGYVFEGDADDEAVFADELRGLELLMAHARIHRAELTAGLAAREAEAVRRAREAALNPPKPKNQTIYFWKIPAP